MKQKWIVTTFKNIDPSITATCFYKIHPFRKVMTVGLHIFLSPRRAFLVVCKRENKFPQAALIIYVPHNKVYGEVDKSNTLN